MKPIQHIAKQLGFTLTEVLITIGIIGVVTAVALPIFNNINGNQVERNLLSTQNSIQVAFSNYAMSQGLIPREITPDRVIIQKLKLSNGAPVVITSSSSPQNPVGLDPSTMTYPIKKITLPNNTKVYISSSWTESSNRQDYTNVYIEDKDGNALYSSIYRSGQSNDGAILAEGDSAKGNTASTAVNVGTSTTTTDGGTIPIIPNNTTAIKFSLLTRRTTNKDFGTNWLQIMNSSRVYEKDGEDADVADFIYDSLKPLEASVRDAKAALKVDLAKLSTDLKLTDKEAKTLVECEAGLTKKCQTSISNLINKFQKLKPPDTASINKLIAFRSGTVGADGKVIASMLQEFDSIQTDYNSRKSVIDTKLSKISAISKGENTSVLFLSQTIDVLKDLSFKAFAQEAKFSMGDGTPMNLNDFIQEFKKTPYYTSMSANLKNNFIAVGGWYAMTAILMQNASTNEAMGLKVTYTDPGTGQPYVMDSSLTFTSPVKVSLKHRPALIDNTNQFLFDNDGAKHHKHPIIKTYGGLGADEAWLALDRSHNGFYINNTVLDGEDIFGDHMGKYPSGYEDLAETFKTFIRIDAKGQKYIELHQPNWLENAWVSLQRLFGQNTKANPSYDLKLLTRGQEVLNASSVFKKVYVDYWDVNELDPELTNWIRQRSYVQHIDGKYEQSADQWFRPKITFALSDTAPQN